MIENTLKSYLKTHRYNQFDIKAVLFDMDGVLFDSMKWHAKSWKQTMDEYGFATTPEEFYLYEGMVGSSTIRYIIEREEQRVPTEQEVNQIYKTKSELFAQMNDQSLMRGAKEVVALVEQLGLLCTLVTGSGQPTLLGLMSEKFGTSFPKERMVTAYDVTKGKPDPEPYLLGLEKSGNLKPNQAIVIENAPRGIESAVAAGIFTIAVNTGPLSPDVLKEAGADIVYSSMEELLLTFNTLYDLIDGLTIS